MLATFSRRRGSRARRARWRRAGCRDGGGQPLDVATRTLGGLGLKEEDPRALLRCLVSRGILLYSGSTDGQIPERPSLRPFATTSASGLSLCDGDFRTDPSHARRTGRGSAPDVRSPRTGPVSSCERLGRLTHRQMPIFYREPHVAGGSRRSGDGGVSGTEIDEIITEFVVEAHENLDLLDRELMTLEGNPSTPGCWPPCSGGCTP